MFRYTYNALSLRGCLLTGQLFQCTGKQAANTFSLWKRLLRWDRTNIGQAEAHSWAQKKMQPYIVPTTGMCKLSSCQDVETQHVCTQHHATQIQKQLSAKHFDLCFVAPIVLYPCGRCYICPWVLGLYFFIPMSQAEGLPDPWFQANKSTFFIRESILAQQQAISKTLASSDILTVWYKTNFIFCCENPYSPPSVSPPTAANRAGTSDWSRCPSPGRSSPLGILCRLNLPAETARFRKINPRCHAPMDGIAIPSRDTEIGRLTFFHKIILYLAWRLVWLIQLASKKCSNPHL